MTHPHALPPLKVSQKARDAAADLWRGYIGANPKSHTAKEIAAGNMDHHPVARAFARFERDLSAPSGEGDARAIANTIALITDPSSETQALWHAIAFDAATMALASTATKLAEAQSGIYATDMRRRAIAAESRLAQAVAALTEITAMKTAWSDASVVAASTLAQIRGAPAMLTTDDVVADLASLKAERDALNARIALFEEGARKAAYDASMRGQLIAINERRVGEGKRQISMAEFNSGILMDDPDGQ